MKTIIPLAILCFFLSGCVSKQNENNPELLIKGGQISGKLIQALMSKLNTEIQEKGLPGAISYCSLHALPLTDSISKMEQVELSRVSHKFRNPLNAANEKEIEIIEGYIAQQQKGKQLTPQIITENGRSVYYSPIVLASPTCLSCHGDFNKIDADVLKAISEKYPNDKAINFDLNEIRGLFKIVFNKELQ